MPPTLKSLASLYKPLTTEFIQSELVKINAEKSCWKFQQLANDQLLLIANYKLKSFPKTWLFLSDIARIAHKTKHHPTIINTYNRIELHLTTHDAKNQVTIKDLDLARYIQECYLRHTVKASKFDEVRDFVTDLSDQSLLSHVSKEIENLVSKDKN